jgi:hypothetical protein
MLAETLLTLLLIRSTPIYLVVLSIVKVLFLLSFCIWLVLLACSKLVILSILSTGISLLELWVETGVNRCLKASRGLGPMVPVAPVSRVKFGFFLSEGSK